MSLSVSGGSNNRVGAVLELVLDDKGSSFQIRVCEIGLWKAVIYNPKATKELSQKDNYPGSKQAKVSSPRAKRQKTPTALLVAA